LFAWDVSLFNIIVKVLKSKSKMKKSKLALLLIVTFVTMNVIKAQTIEDGRRFLYYERYKSARQLFEKLVAVNPANVEAVYWLGQSFIGPETDFDYPAAKQLYQKTLMANPNSPLLLVGMGHVELLENKPQDAKNRFETAISLTQSKNIAVLNAIGFANVHAPNGDPTYAIDKLKTATTLKGMKDPDVYANLGDAYKRLADGGNSQTAYENALTLNPAYARSSYRIGKIYQTQGIAQEEIYMRYFNEAIAKDSAYGPVYENLQQYYYLTNVKKSALYLDKYLVNTDDNPKNCFYRAQMKYAQGLFAETITKADECISTEGVEPYPNLYGLKAYAYNKLDDSLNSKSAFELYFEKQVPDKIGPTDNKTYAEVLLKFPDNDSLAGIYIDKAIAADSTEVGKVATIKTMTSYYEARKKYKNAADWYMKVLDFRKEIRKTDLYNAGNNYTKGGEYQKSVDVFEKYISLFPAESFGYYMNAKNFLRIDSADTEGKSFNYYTKIIDMTEQIKDKSGEPDRIKGALRYMIEFYANVKRDKDSALLYCDKAIALDSTDVDFKHIREIISSANITPLKNTPAKDAKPSQTKPSGTKPAGNKTSLPKQAEAKK
jgi:predicted Zn-dependent protease